MQMNSDVSKVRGSLYTGTNLLLIYLRQNADTRTHQRYQSVRTAVFILVRMKSDCMRSFKDNNVNETPNVSMFSVIQWKRLITIILGLALFDNNNQLITLSGGYKNLHYLTQFIITVQHFTCIKKQPNLFLKTCVLLPVVCLQLVVPESSARTHNAFGSVFLYVAHHDEDL
jgi:hypothetical protein